MDRRILSRAYALARKNAALARLKHQQEVPKPQPEFKVGDSVYLRKYVRTKIEPRWSRYWKITAIHKEKRTVMLEHEQTGKVERANVRNIVLRDPLIEILRNSRLDTIPGRSKLYMRADDLENLRWPAIKSAPRVSREDMERLKEVVRDRSRDTQPQKQPPQRDAPSKRTTVGLREDPEEELPDDEVMDETDEPSQARQRARPRWMDDYITGVVTPGRRHTSSVFFHSNCT